MQKTLALLCMCTLLLVPALTAMAAGTAGEQDSAAEPAAAHVHGTLQRGADAGCHGGVGRTAAG